VTQMIDHVNKVAPYIR